MNKEFEKIDYVLFGSFMFLLLAGFIMIYSSSSVLAYEKYGDGAYFFKRQFIYALLGAAGAVVFFKADIRAMKKYTPYLLLAAAALIFAVHFPGFGREAGGAKRWLRMGPLPSFQPFEIAKLFYVIYLAYVFSSEKAGIKSSLIKTAVVTFVICVGLIFQRDFGGIVIIVSLYVLMLFIGGVPLRVFFLLIPAVAAGFIYLIRAEPYRIKRIFTYLDPWQDYYGAGWQTIQSLIAIGSGGVFGTGLSQSQQKFHYLPTPHTDYIYSIIGEELGIAGTLAILGMFFVILWRGLYIALNVKDKYFKLLAAGITFMIIIQAFVHIGVTTGL
ncbi:MAG TPA: putative peptidoglycan glycosyltransferase FtsW, partial [Spirochaetota bacterium]|nr:putative peptidoglycan glycosyltransferase FtsW [Spirochaetota bacterium]